MLATVSVSVLLRRHLLLRTSRLTTDSYTNVDWEIYFLIDIYYFYMHAGLVDWEICFLIETVRPLPLETNGVLLRRSPSVAVGGS